MKAIQLYDKRIILFDKFIGIATQEPYINISPSGLSFDYQSGTTHIFDIISNTNYTIIPSESWIGVNHSSGSRNLTVTVEMLTENSGLVSRQGTVTIENTEFSITKVVTIIQNFDVQPLLYIMTEGGEFQGELI